jgi:acetylornithine deacetylase/succinyl-diaminopimelate desuccinylase-like protein
MRMPVPRSAGWGLIALVLLPCCSTGRPAEVSRAAPPAAGSSSPDFDASAARVRKLLEELVAADTENPPGNEGRAAAIGAERLQAAGIPYQLFEFAPGRQNLIARIKGNGSAKPLLLLAHTDVVPTARQTWTSSPHRLTEKDGYLVGRGTTDDLSDAAVDLEVLMLLYERKVALRRDVIVAWTGDEERGGVGVRWQLQHHPESLDAGLAFNEGGGVEVDASGNGKSAAVHVAEKIYQDFSVRAQGKSGHSSRPVPDNAIYKLAAALQRLGEYRFPARFLPVTRAFFLATADRQKAEIGAAMRAVASARGDFPQDALKSLDENPAIASLLRTTCVATQLAGGTGPNVLPADARANVNCRILPDETVEGTRRRLQEVAGNEVEVVAEENFGGSPPIPSDGEGPAAIEAVTHRFFPGIPVVPYMSNFVTDSRQLRAAGILAYGFSGMALTDEEASRAHAADERIPAGALRRAVEITWSLVLALAAAR